MNLTKEKVLVAMSGGVDSSVTACMIKTAGYDAVGATMRLTSKELPLNSDSDDDIIAARESCKKLMIEHHVLDLREEFREKVIDEFVSAYLQGSTPNPCIICNKKIKFGALIREGENLSCGKIATGHYATIEKSSSGRYIIKCAKDMSKDQSYMFWSLSQDQLSKIILPLGELTKAQVREIASSLGFSNARKKDSQDVCFVPDGDYAKFIEMYSKVPSKQGNYIDMNGNILGIHKGIIHYTIGQRKGLNIALGHPMFVYEKSAKENTVTLCENSELFKKSLTAKSVNFIATDSLSKTETFSAKIRYGQNSTLAKVTQIEKDRIFVEFSEPVRAISKGQSLVLYDGNTLVGGGIIE